MPVASASATASASAAATAAPRPSRTAQQRRKVERATTASASGASCVGAGNGEFGRWRGSSISAASAWGYDGETYSIDGDHDYARFAGIMDYAPQYDLKPAGTPFSWEGMKNGAFDGRITADLQRLKTVWGGKQGALYYRFQHEFNGDWYRWTVDEGNVGAMVAGWRRMAGLFRDVLFGDDPRFRIAWGPNAGSAPKRIKDVRSAWPGAEYVDVIAIDYYDWFATGNASEFARSADALDSGGGPIGIEAWARFAAQQGVPWSVAEWANQFGDRPAYIQGMHDSFVRHAYSGQGSAAGKLVYECYFNEVFPNGNVGSSGDFRVQVSGQDNPGRPNAARKYRELFA